MADNLSWTPGAGAEIATDQAGDDTHVQIVKLAMGADGEKTSIPADAQGLKTDAASRGQTISGGMESCGNVTPVPSVEGSGYIAPSGSRRSLMIQNVSGVDIWIGPSTVQQGQGLFLANGQTAVFDKAPCAAYYIWADSANPVTVSWFEELD